MSPLHINNIEKNICLFCKLFINYPYKQKDSFNSTKIVSWTQLKKILCTKDKAYSSSYFDCVTFVETILALALSNPNIKKINGQKFFSETFENYLTKIRYHKKNCYIQKKHFPCIDWEKKNSWLLTNITKKLPKHKTLTYNVNKINWLFYKKNVSFFLENNHSVKLIKTITCFLKKHGLNFHPKISKIYYIDYQNIKNNFKTYKNLLPAFGIIYFIAPKKNMISVIGTNLPIFHMGFFFKKNNTIMLTHASYKQKKVESIKLLPYLNTLNTYYDKLGLSFLTIKDIL